MLAASINFGVQTTQRAPLALRGVRTGTGATPTITAAGPAEMVMAGATFAKPTGPGMEATTFATATLPAMQRRRHRVCLAKQDAGHAQAHSATLAPMGLRSTTLRITCAAVSRTSSSTLLCLAKRVLLIPTRALRPQVTHSLASTHSLWSTTTVRAQQELV